MKLLRQKRGEGLDIPLSVWLGMVLALFSLIVVAYVAAAIYGFATDIIRRRTEGKPNGFDLASPVNFYRLNNEIAQFVDDTSHPFLSKAVPYTIGGGYILIGFNEDPALLSCIPKNKEYFPPRDCVERACLCLCNAKEKLCKNDDCVRYSNVDYFISGPIDGSYFKRRFKGGRMDEVYDPLFTGQPANCLVIDDSGTINDWGTRLIYLEKATVLSTGKTFVFLYENGTSIQERHSIISQLARGAQCGYQCRVGEECVAMGASFICLQAAMGGSAGSGGGGSGGVG